MFLRLKQKILINYAISRLDQSAGLFIMVLGVEGFGD